MIKTQVQHPRFGQLFAHLSITDWCANSNRNRMPDNENKFMIHLRQECSSL